MSFTNPNDPRLQKYRAHRATKKHAAVEKTKIRDQVVALHPKWSDKKREQVVEASFRAAQAGKRVTIRKEARRG